MVSSCKIAKYGTYNVLDKVDDLIIETSPIKTIDESMFYKLYLELNNVLRYKKVDGEVIDMLITDAPLELLVYLMSKDDSYTLVFRNKDAKLMDVANDLNRSINSVYNSVSKLKKAGYLVITEDGLITPNKECSDLMKEVKSTIKNKGHFVFDYLFKFCVK